MSGTQITASSPAVTPGNWITQTINGMQYDVLLPANYNPVIKYPTVLYLHQLDMGDDPSGLLAEVNPWFNTATFRADYPAIVVMPLLDQTADPSGQTINFGGVSTADTAGENNAIAALKQVMTQYSSDSSRVYVTGNSLGGIGTEDMVIKYNAYTGTEGKIFAAALSLAGADYGQGYPTPNQSVVTALKNVPFMAIHGGQDTQVPLAWDQNLYAAEQAIGGDMKYTQDNSLGHDVWDTYYTQDGTGSPLGWLFSQSTGAAAPAPVPPSGPLPTPSANDTVVKAGSTAAITDASGNKWTISAAGQVAVNGTADTTTANVIELAYVNGTIWQENASKLWWGETQPNAAWSPAAGTAASPLPAAPAPAPTPAPKPTPSANDTVVTGTTAAITDTSGNKWTINAAGQVAINGTADTTTAGVIELAYVNGTIWQENASKLWWGETQPNAAWSPAAGTATSPLPAAPAPTPTPAPTPAPAPKPTHSANDTVVTGTTAAITDTSGNKWTINAAGQVAINGTADTTTASVIELAYVNGTIWQENASKLWWGETQPNAAWSPAAGTATSPLPAAPAPTPTPAPPPTPAPKPTPSANDTVVKAGSTAAITDAGGNKWTINAAGQVAVNGTADTTTAGVIELAYVNGTIWQENASKLWWGETQPNAAWSPTAGTATSPLPAASATTPAPVTTPAPAPIPTPAPTPAGTRDPSQTPFASTSVFNLPLGLNAQWQYNAQLASAAVFVNTVGNYNENIYTGAASDPLITITSTAAAGGTPGTFQVHIPVGAVPASGNDQTFSVDDTATHTWYGFGGFNWTGSNTATVSQGSGESDFGSGIQVDGSDWDEGVGTLRQSDLTAGTIDHMLRMELPFDMLQSYSSSAYQLAPYAWPQNQEDGFGPSVYSGTIPYGVTIGIAATAVEPADVKANAGANMLWQALQDHGAMVRDSGGSGNGVIFQADQTVNPNDPLIQGMDQFGAEIMAQAQILINQGPNSVNGGGTPIVPLDPAPSDAPASATTTTPAAPPATPASVNDTMVLAGASNAITDASGNKWTINAAGQVAVNGTADTTTANVTELAYVNNAVWQENAANLWWGKTSPNAAWAPGAGTTASPLPAPVTIGAGTASTTVSQSQVSVVASVGTHMLFLQGSANIVTLSGGADTIADTGSANTYILPAAGNGSVTFTSNILTTTDTLDLKTTLGATNWDRAAATLAQYLTVTDSTKGATISVASTAGGVGVAVATINGATTLNLSGLLAHAIT